MIKKALGKAFAAQRKASGMTQEGVAVASGYSLRYYQSLEAGDKLPTLPTIFKIAHAMGADPADIIGPAFKTFSSTQK